MTFRSSADNPAKRCWRAYLPMVRTSRTLNSKVGVEKLGDEGHQPRDLPAAHPGEVPAGEEDFAPVSFRRPWIARIRVLLPEPFGPRMETNSPSSRSEIDSPDDRAPPYPADRPLVSNIGMAQCM